MIDLTPTSPSLGSDFAPSRGEAPEVRARPLRPAYDPQSPYRKGRAREGDDDEQAEQLEAYWQDLCRRMEAMSPEAA